MKLLNNLLSATAMAISTEALVLGVKAGLDANQIIEVINAGTGRNSATADKIPRFVIPRTFAVGAHFGVVLTHSIRRRACSRHCGSLSGCSNTYRANSSGMT